MRTIEETREWAQNRLDTLSRYPFCEACLNALIAFIDSPPPCKHKNAFRYQEYSYIERLYRREAEASTFCPDCGERLVPESKG